MLNLQAFLGPAAILQTHHRALENLTWQVHVLSNCTRYAFGDLNKQMQQLSKMMLQNHLTLDMLLLKSKEYVAC